jgi:PEGA domain
MRRSSTSRKAWPFFAAMAVTLAASPAASGADETSVDLLRRGVELRRERRDAEALASFRAAVDRENTPIARAELALAEQALGRWIDAERDLALALEAHDDWIEKNARPLSAALDEIRGHLGWLVVVTEPAAATITVDGRAIGLGERVRVDAGDHTIEARASGYLVATQRVTIPGGDTARATLTLLPDVVVHPPATRSDVGPTVGKWVLAGVGIAGIAAGTSFGVQTIREKNARDEQCASGACTAAAFRDDHDARWSATVSTVSFGVGLAALAGAAIWVLVDRPHRPPRPAIACAF